MQTASLIPDGTTLELKKKGASHPLRDMIQISREILLDLGFDEVENRTILSKDDVYREYGPEAPVILDRAFYLAKLPRPDIGLSKEKIARIRALVGEFDVEALQGILRSYKRGEIESDDFIEVLVDRLSIEETATVELLDKIFCEFKNLNPVATDLTLRSHMTGTWYHTLSSLQEKASFPIALFAVGPRYRNEQREDATHLCVHHSASVVIMDAEMSLEAGKRITEKILTKYGFKRLRFEVKKATANYYAPGLEQEVFAECGGKWFEIADLGMYSPISLANFGIRYPVFNVGLGMERLAMVLNGHQDIRELVFPQFYRQEFSDQEIAGSLCLIDKPVTAKGKMIAEAIERTAVKHKNQVGPCEFHAWNEEGLEIRIVEKEKNKKLIGPAGFNRITVANGMINSGISPAGALSDFNFMQALSMRAAAIIERSAEVNTSETFQVKMAKALSDVNLRLPSAIRQCVEGRQKEIRVRGPVFLTIKYRIRK
jgi:O-phosphoseryl-tRNA synthetase